MVRAALMHRHRRGGAALVAAMLVAALAAAIVASLASGQVQWLRQVELRRDQVQAQALVQAGLQWARQVVFEDRRLGPIDHLGEPWAFPLPPTPLDNGSVEGSIVDAQSRLNANLLGESGVLADIERERFARLFARLGVPPERLDALADWIDGDDVARPLGAEDAWYRDRDARAVAANGPLVRTAEIAAVKGFDERTYASLSPFIVALPARAPLNVNTASPEVLAATVPGLDGDDLSALVASRAQRPFATVAEFRSRLPPGARSPDERTIGVSSDHFLVTVIARQGESIARGRALLKRRDGGWPIVLWQTIE